MSVVLSEHLPLLASAPDGIQKLRGLILELAVRGKLVPQDPNDEPASELLKRIANERTRLEAEGTCRKSKPTPAVSNDEQPFTLPEGWVWIRLGQIGDWGAGATPLRSNPRYYGGSIPWFKSGELTSDLISDAEEHVTELALKECSLRQNRTGDVLIAMYGATIGKTAIQAKPATTNQAVCACTPNTGVFNRYLLTLLKALKPNFIGQGAGGAQPNISREKIVATVAALPPEAEQHRIVAKVDELMALCDRLEAEQADAASAHARLVETLLGTLTQSTDAADLAANWQRLAEHFDTLFTTEASIDALKQTVLQLAVMGRLVTQNPADEPASELLKRITAMRALMESKGDCKKSKPLPPVDNEERHHSIPASWEYVRLQEVCLTITDGTHQTPRYTESGRPFLSAQNVKPFRFMPESFRYVSEEDYQGYIKTTKPEFGDVLLTRVGAMIGEAAVIDKRMDFAIYVSLALLKPCQPFVSPEFITLWLNSPFGTHSSIRDTLGRGVSAGNLNLGMIRAFALPLPPIGEQQRIVTRAHELMVLCDSLKADLITARQRQATLADTLIESALEAA